MEIFELETGAATPYENNPRFNDHAVEPVKNSIREFGFKVPILVDKNNVIIAGHTRVLAAKELGMETVPAIRVEDLSEEQINAFRLADNKVAEYAQWDTEKLVAEIDKIASMNMTELFGFFDEQRFSSPEDIANEMDDGDIDNFFIDAEPELRDGSDKNSGGSNAGEANGEASIVVTVMPTNENEYNLLKQFLEENGLRYVRE